jgi:hypothetical protein
MPYCRAFYSASYISKPEEPERTKVIRKIDQYLNYRAEQTHAAPTLQDRLRSVCDAILGSTTVGACQANYFLLGLPFVECSRRFLDVNIQPQQELTVGIITDVDVLSQLGPEEPVYKRGSILSQAGRRELYTTFCKQQISIMSAPKRTRTNQHWRRRCDVSFAAFLSNYHYWKPQGSRHQRLFGHDPPLLGLQDATMRIVPIRDDPRNLSHTFTLSHDGRPIAFELQDSGKEYVLVYHPHLAVDYADESKCFALLLMHLPWNEDGEAGLLLHPIVEEQPFASAVDAVKYYMTEHIAGLKGFPRYVKPALEEQYAYDERRRQDADDRMQWRREQEQREAERDNMSDEDNQQVFDNTGGYDSDDRDGQHVVNDDDDNSVDEGATYAFAESTAVRHDMSNDMWHTYKSFIQNENDRFLSNRDRANERRGVCGTYCIIVVVSDTRYQRLTIVAFCVQRHRRRPPLLRHRCMGQCLNRTRTTTPSKLLFTIHLQTGADATNSKHYDASSRI